MSVFADLVATSSVVAATSKRTEKVAALRDLLAGLETHEVAIAVGFLVGEPRQRRLGVGWATAWGHTTPAADRPSLHLSDVDDTFDALATVSGSGSVTERQRLVAALFARATDAEQAFLRDLLTGGLRQGALEGVLTDAVAKAADVPLAALRRAAMLSGDLGRAATVALSEGVDGLAAIGLAVGTPIQPMLASTAASVAEAAAAIGRCSIEWKLDGIRIQVHRDGDVVRIYTRNLNDVTARLPDVVRAVSELASTCFVLDGELIGLSERDEPRLFQDTASSFAAEDAATFRLTPFFFDCLHSDGTDLIDLPLFQRQAVLGRVVGAMCIPTLATDAIDEATSFAQTALDAGHEGVMVKALDSVYEAGRRGKSWRKVKPVKTLDLVVIGAEWGHGRRQGWLSNLHLGARDPNGGPPIMVGKTFKGLTDELLRWQTAEFQARETGTSGITVWVRPELVVEIAVDGVQRSVRYPGGVALRFARVKKYRADKRPEDADTIDAVRELQAASGAGAPGDASASPITPWLPGGRASRRAPRKPRHRSRPRNRGALGMSAIPMPSVIVLVGPSGAGKSTWAAELVDPDTVLSSDRFRAFVGSDERDITVSADAFELLDIAIERRVARKLTTVIDTLGMDADRRAFYRDVARRSGLPCACVIFETPAALCRERNRARPRPVPAAVLDQQFKAMARYAPVARHRRIRRGRRRRSRRPHRANAPDRARRVDPDRPTHRVAIRFAGARVHLARWSR